jgi:hypothetical protein
MYCVIIDHYLRSIWLGRLPPNVWTHLAGRPEIDLDTAVHCADRILEATSPSAISSICQTNGTPELEQRFDDLCVMYDPQNYPMYTPKLLKCTPKLRNV